MDLTSSSTAAGDLPGSSSNAIGPVLETHRLCSVCWDMCRKSGFLRLDVVSDAVDDESLAASPVEIRTEARQLVIYREGNEATEHFLHHRSKQDLERAARLGCHLCSLAANARWKLNIELDRFGYKHEPEHVVESAANDEREEENEGLGSSSSVQLGANRDNLILPHPHFQDNIQELITPFDDDFEGPRGSSSAFYNLSGGQWNIIELQEDGMSGSDQEPAQSEESEDSDSPMTVREFRELKMGIWCNIISTFDGSPSIKISFREYGAPGGNRTTDDIDVLSGEIDSCTRSSCDSSHSTDSQFTLDVAKEWLNECIQEHADCRHRTFDPASLPTRLLDLGDLQDSSTICVQDSVNIGTSYQYLALSHCWGNVQTTALLTFASLERYHAAIHMQELPKTFQDAVTITRRLGYRYLWIDSLCIIQNSKEDWNQESAKMGDIYRNSACCIAAVASENSDGGCFFSRNPLDYFPCRLGYKDGNEILVTVNPDQKEHGYDYTQSVVSGKPLWSRAWVFQEMALAPRTLSWDRSIVHWECLTWKAWESFSGLRKPSGSQSVKKYISQVRMLGERANTGINSSHSDDIRIEWGKIVTAYSRGNLTRETDKLVALSGLASRIWLYTGWHYLAGLWEENILSQMFWFHDTRVRGVPGKRPQGYRAPTWSWASMDENIRWYHPNLKCKWLATLVHVHVDLMDRNYPFSEVAGGTLQLRGPTLTSHELKKRAVSTTDPDHERYGGKEYQFSSGGDLTIYRDEVCPCWDPCESCSSGLVFLLLGDYEKAAEPPLKRYVHSQIGLVLAPVEGDGHCYRRVGWFQEHLRLKKSTFADRGVTREVIIL